MWKPEDASNNTFMAFSMVPKHHTPFSPELSRSQSKHTQLTRVGGCATEGSCNTTTTERADESHNGGVATEARHDQRTHEVEDVERGQHPRLLVAAPPSLHTAVHTNEFLGFLVETFLGEDGALLDLEADLQERGEGVGEIADTEGADQTAEVTEFGNSSCHDEGERPVDGHTEAPEDLALLRCKSWEVCYTVLEFMSSLNKEDAGSRTENLHEDVVVDDLDADVSIQGSRNQTTYCSRELDQSAKHRDNFSVTITYLRWPGYCRLSDSCKG